MENLEKGAENIESEKLVYHFDVRQKHPESKELYKKIGDGSGDFEKMLKEWANPFTDLDGREILYKDTKAGTIHVREEPFPQCTYKTDGHQDCGFFYQIEVDIESKDIDMQTAIQLVQEAAHGRRVDYFELQEQVKVEDGYSIKEKYLVDPKTSKASPHI